MSHDFYKHKFHIYCSDPLDIFSNKNYLIDFYFVFIARKWQNNINQSFKLSHLKQQYQQQQQKTKDLNIFCFKPYFAHHS